MKPFNITRRRMLRGIAGTSVAGIMGTTLAACGSDDGDDLNTLAVAVDFKHGIASGDPLANRVIIWTRATPDRATSRITLQWEMSTDENFSIIVGTGNVATTPEQDYTVKVDVTGLAPNTFYYYRFKFGNKFSPAGRTKTLPKGDIDSVRLAVVNCSNYPAGYFHVMREVANGDFDAILHLGDYIYEYGAVGVDPEPYASEDAVALGRVVDPPTELFSLPDYRLRYAQYRTDPDMQAAHASAPFICIWDDHEVADNAWVSGAANHEDGEGDYSARKLAGIQAFYEWLPIRPPSADEDDLRNLWRIFSFGNLIDLYMVDTRHYARDEQLDFADYTNPETHQIDDVRLRTDLALPRNMLGTDQRNWLVSQLEDSDARWQVLGQQILMGRMLIPAPIMAAINSLDIAGGLAAIGTAVTAKNTPEGERTQEQIALLASAIPYNLDAWDGYPAERELLFTEIAEMRNKRNLIVLSGDSHNAWGNQLRRDNGDIVGVELAATSISSPGLEYYLGVGDLASVLEDDVKTLIDDLKLVNLVNRGYLDVTFTNDSVAADWRFVNTVKELQYREYTERNFAATVDWATLTLTPTV